MRKHFRVAFLFVCFLFFSSNIFSQEINGSGIWVGNDLKIELSKKFDFNFSQEIREVVSPPQLGTVLFETGIDYAVTKHFTVSGFYRLDVKSDLQLQHRAYFDFSLEKKLKKKFTTELRLRVQREFVLNKIPDNYLRPKFSVKYKASKKISPYIDGELFYHAWYKGNQFDSYRLSAGMNYDWSKKFSTKLFYLFDKEFNVAYPQQQNIIGISFGEDL